MALLAVVAMGLRGALVIWAATRFVPAEDGKYYHIVAWRIARGLGYTWLWPDGAVTYAAHYPVGYPALLGGLYALFGPRAWLGMLLNAVLGSLAVAGVYRLTAAVASRRGALIAGVIAAVHPTLLLYTPALMTEILSASLLAIGAWMALAAAERESGCKTSLVLGLGILMGLAVLVRPQQLVLAPALGWIALSARSESHPKWKAGAAGALVVTALAVMTCLPWTFRNCERMGRCMLVSANAGWNLLIGTAVAGNGAWVAVDKAGIPEGCRTVFDEAQKDVCFGAGAIERVSENPRQWLALVPKKLERTFDDVGTPGWYLHSSNWRAFPEQYKNVLGASEVLVDRVILLLAALAVLRMVGRRPLWRAAIVLLAMACMLVPLAWLGILLLVVASLSLGRRLLAEPPLLLAIAGLGSTALIHAVFFGGARYAIVTLPWTIALAGCAWRQGDEKNQGESPRPLVTSAQS
jgi:4-amino-4-deoxy-L-arabinose transferase-like glycosyltransferase